MIFRIQCNHCIFLNESVNKLGPNGITKILSRAWCDQHILYNSAIYATDTAQNCTVHIIPKLFQTCQIFSLFSASGLWRKIKKIWLPTYMHIDISFAQSDQGADTQVSLQNH